MLTPVYDHFYKLKFIHLFKIFNGRNERGREMLSLVENLLEITSTISSVKLLALS